MLARGLGVGIRKVAAKSLRRLRVMVRLESGLRVILLGVILLALIRITRILVML